MLLCISEKLFCLCFFQNHRFFTENMLSMLKRHFDVFVMRFVRRRNVNRVNRSKEIFNFGIGINLPFLGKPYGAFCIRIIYALCIYTANKLHFRYKPLRNTSCSDNSNSLNMLILSAKHCAGNILSSFKIYNLTIIVKMIKLTDPV
ncbi:hypothetical protein D3C73_1022610 [compost metagenome]